MLWSMESITRCNRSHGHQLHPDIAPDVLTLSSLDPDRSGRESEVDSARLSLTIIQFTAHVILISNTQSQQAHICKSYKSPLAMGERGSSRWRYTGSCSCGPAHRRLGSVWSLFFVEWSSTGNSAAELSGWADLFRIALLTPLAWGRG